MRETIEVEGPYFEDLKVGAVLDDAPGVTMTAGHAAVHQALFGDRLRLPLDASLCEKVTGNSHLLVNPSLVCNVAIGQTTYASQRVKGNLFYRGLILKRPVFAGDTLRTTTRVVGSRQNKSKPGRAATGMVALEVHVENHHREEVMLFWRCPMIPCRDPEAQTGYADSFDAIPQELDMEAVKASVPAKWDLDSFRAGVPGAHFVDLAEAGTKYVVASRDTITCAPELARLTLNMATTHTDAGSSAYNKRLVYGGHTITMAAAQLTRALPNLVTLLAWRHCDHTAPVFENDIVRTEVVLEAKHPLEPSGGLVDLHARVFAERGDQAPKPETDVQVLDWRAIGLMA